MSQHGTGHTKQFQLFKTDWKHRFSHGGTLRNYRSGRGQRPLSSKEPIHVVLKINSHRLRQRSLRSPVLFSLVQNTVARYAKRFAIKIKQISVQHDHIHALIRFTRRSQCQFFLRVVAGQVAQVLQKRNQLRNVTDTPTKGTKLWKHRPFTRVVRGWKAYKVVRDYIQLNECEATGKIAYKKNRLKGLSSGEWEILRG